MVPLPLPAWSLPLGALLDAWLGDPRGWPHPVRAIGRLIVWTEASLRWLIGRLHGGARAERLAGSWLAAIVVGTTSVVVLGLLMILDRLGEWPSLIGRSVLVFWGLAANSLGREALRASEAEDLATARRELAMIVGRDTDALDRSEICRACVETVAENSNDGVVAPLFWFALGGPVGLWAYKAVNTLDSMVGYRNDRYRDFGWASARLDDLAGLVPARLTWLLVAVAAVVVRERPVASLRIGWRDGRNHPSPNAAWSEAAMAGALNVQLGGPATYSGVPGFKPLLGDPGDPIDAMCVRRAVRILHATTLLALIGAWGVHSWILGLA